VSLNFVCPELINPSSGMVGESRTGRIWRVEFSLQLFFSKIPRGATVGRFFVPCRMEIGHGEIAMEWLLK
jgi:hypothetical protein